MTGIEIVLSALAAGASAGAADAVRDAYAGLRAMVTRIRRGGQRRDDDRSLVTADDTDPVSDEPALRAALQSLNARQLDELVKAAQQLLVHADPAGWNAGKYQLAVSSVGEGHLGDTTIQVTSNYGAVAGTFNAPVTITPSAPLPPPPPGAA